MERVWDYWNRPEYIIHWAFALDEWEAPSPSNNLQIGGKFKITMAAKDKSASFNYYCHNDTSEEDISSLYLSLVPQ